MRRLVVTAVLASVVAGVPGTLTATPLAGPGCQITGGFRALRDQVDAVGDCVEDAHTDAATGNVLQRTTGGLLVWRPRGSWTGFTDGQRTWVVGPFGLQQRAATQRFDWEDALAPVPPPDAAGARAGEFAQVDQPFVTPIPAPPPPESPPSAPAAPPPAAGASAPIAPLLPVTPGPSLPSPTATPLAASCVPGPTNDDASRAAPIGGGADGVMPPAVWSRSGSQPDQITYRYYSFVGDGGTAVVGVNVVDDGGYKVQVNVYAPDGSLAGSASVGAHERQEVVIRPTQVGTYVVQLWNRRPADVAFHVDLRRG